MNDSCNFLPVFLHFLPVFLHLNPPPLYVSLLQEVQGHSLWTVCPGEVIQIPVFSCPHSFVFVLQVMSGDSMLLGDCGLVSHLSGEQLWKDDGVHSLLVSQPSPGSQQNSLLFAVKYLVDGYK